MARRFGIGLFTGQIPSSSSRTFSREYDDTLELIRLAERTGFDSAWVSEHHGSSDGYLPSLLTFLAAAAAVTERIELGTGVILAPLHDPLRLAEDAAVVDQLSAGRLVLGLGVGWREEEFRMFGVPVAERATRIDETVEILRRAFTGERFSFDGRAYRYDRVRVTPPPARPGGPPILLGGYADAAVARAGRVGDGYVTDDASPEELRAYVEIVDGGAREVGRDPSDLAFVLLQNVWIDRIDDAVRAGIAHQLGAYDAWDAGADTPAADALPAPTLSDREIATSTASGSPAEIVETLRPRLEALDDRDVTLVVRLHYPGMDLAPASRAVERFATEVIPELRG
jgi:probable F420-dependent oxidoreductase